MMSRSSDFVGIAEEVDTVGLYGMFPYEGLTAPELALTLADLLLALLDCSDLSLSSTASSTREVIMDV